MTTPGRALEPLRNANFRLFAGATLVSLVGDGLFRVAISLQVYALVQDPRALATVAFAWALGQFLLLPVGGWAADRYPRRTLLVAADLWRGLAIGAMGLLSLTNVLSVGQMVIVGLLFGAGNAFFNPAATSYLPDIVDVEQLPRANAVLGGLRPVMLYVAGPLLGGLVVGVAGPGIAFGADAVTFAFSAFLLARLPAQNVARHDNEDEETPFVSPWRSAAQGVRLVTSARWLWVGMLALAISGLAYHGPFEVLVPFILVSDFGQTEGEAARNLALILAASGVGSVGTAWWISRRELPQHFLRAFYLGEACALLMLTGLGLMTSIWQGVLAGLVLGAMFALTEVVWTTTLQRNVSRDALGRVSSLDWMLSIGVAPISFAIAGLLGAVVEPRVVLVTAGLAGALALASLSFTRGVLVPARSTRVRRSATPADVSARG